LDDRTFARILARNGFVIEETSMAIESGHRVIAIEEHYYDAEVASHFQGGDARLGDFIRKKIEDLGEGRLAEMDAAGVDVQVLSHGAPSTQKMDPETAVRVARGANDRLRALIDAKPDRFAGFAALPTPDPAAAADELERAVGELGLQGAMVHGLTNGVFFDDERFWPVFERAQSLDVPLYIHPALPHPDVVNIYYKDYAKKFPALLNAAWGFTAETATAGIRIVLSGVLDKYPDLKIILGHLGEGLPFLLWRIDHALSRPGNAPCAFRDAFCRNFYITTSGFFSDPALLCCIQELGVDRILFAIDYPFVDNPLGPAWMESLSLSREDKAKILNGNAKRLLKM